MLCHQGQRMLFGRSLNHSELRQKENRLGINVVSCVPTNPVVPSQTSLNSAMWGCFIGPIEFRQNKKYIWKVKLNGKQTESFAISICENQFNRQWLL